MNQGTTATIAVPHQQPVRLPYAQPQHCRRGPCRPPSTKNFRQNLYALQILQTHRHQAHAFQTFQLGREVTFLLGSYIVCCCSLEMTGCCAR